MSDTSNLRKELRSVQLRLYQLENVYDDEVNDYINSQDYAKYICADCDVGMRLGLRNHIDLSRWSVFENTYGSCFNCIYDSYIRQRRLRYMHELEKDMKKRRKALCNIIGDVE